MSGTAPATLEAATIATALERLLRERGEAAEVADAPLFHGSCVRACCRIVQLAAEAVQHALRAGVLHATSNHPTDADAGRLGAPDRTSASLRHTANSG
jgi:hypothetical protein